MACADIDLKRATSLARTSNAKAFEDWQELLKLPEVEIVVVATLHDSLAEITLAAIESRKYILMEKPAARNAKELEPVVVAANQKGVKVHVGFNHRYHRSLRKAKEIIDSGELGELLSRNNVRVHRRDNYEKRPVLSATIHPDLKRTLVAMSERTGMTVSQVTDEVLYKGLVGMQEMDEL